MTFIALAIFVATLALVIVQPRGLGIGWSATAGALVALAAGVVSLDDVATVWGIVWNATLTFVAIIIISLLLDEAGWFRWAALHVGRAGAGRGRRLLVLVMLLGALVAAVFANDGAALILTPIVFEMLVALGFSSGTTLAFVMAAGFIADTASLPLVISNLTNIIVADMFGLGVGRYALVMVPVDLVAIGASIAVVLWFFRRDVPATYEAEHALSDPREAIADRAVFMAGWWVLGVLLAGLVAADWFGLPVCVIAIAAAVLLLAVAARSPAIHHRRVLLQAPWQIVVFSLGMYIVVFGLVNTGLTDWLAQGLQYLAATNVWLASVATGVLSAVLSAVMNNLPTVLVVALATQAAHASGLMHEAMVYANVVGVDLGPKLTPIGSLATLLWLHVLERRGLSISWSQYCRIGFVLTVPVLLISLSALAGWLWLLRVLGG
ncbi:arsenic transporter [Salinisphaera hydrothermalis]|uniref:Arsenical pump membrane protein n=1 Tax=Salinisphaera hydrothermalis (strain C41B8) TaxID=1304275 RepID=A0A084IGG7_SALHC|nr:arsenic transporter [Salinisphaera hydrothermalis]KEZ75801.1 arsenical pump membrane protein [Salinisphaera hydrothermalis C41B8]